MIENVQGYRFRPEDLRIADRKPGICGFMRVRNGEDFLAEAVCSHLPFYDEIVIAYNQCEDNTEAIVARLAERFPDKVRAFHYVDRVLPLGHPDYEGMPFDEVSSMANYYNLSLAQTRYTVVTKLDDDHIALPRALGPLLDRIRQSGCRLGNTMWCFSGLNLYQKDGRLGVYKKEPWVGTGDHWYFEINPRTYFHNSVKHEVLQRQGMHRRYTGLTYLHGKYLKKGEGFINYELEQLPDSRFARKRVRFERERDIMELDEFIKLQALPAWMRGWLSWLPDKAALRWDRRCRLSEDALGLDLNASMDEARQQARDMMGPLF